MKKTPNLAYVIGVALGDGNLSNPNGRAARLRITCDTQYPRLIRKMKKAIACSMPHNKVSIVRRKKAYCDISCYSKQWESILGWKVGHGTKIEQKISVPSWIFADKKYMRACLLGLLETDGSLYYDRHYKMINFVTHAALLARDTKRLFVKLGFQPTLTTTQPEKSTKYTIRLVRDVEKFIRQTKFEKS